MADAPDFLSMINQSPALKDQLVSVGQDALASGKVKPEQAKAMLKSMGGKPPSDDYITKLLSSQDGKYDFGPAPDKKMAMLSPMADPQPDSVAMQSPQASEDSPVSMQGPMTPPKAAPQVPTPQGPGGLPTLQPKLDISQMPNPGGVAPGKKGSIINSSEKMNQANSMKSNRTTTKTADEFNADADKIRNMPEIKDQQNSLDMLQGRVNDIGAMGTDSSQAWLRPLLQLTDAQTGSDLAKGYQPGGMSPQERQQLLLKYQDEIQKRKADMAKAIVEGTTKLKNGNDQTAQNQSLLQAFGLNQNNSAGAGGALSEVRRNAQIAKAGHDFDLDSILKQFTNTTNSLDRATSMMNGNTPITGKNFALLQQDMINAMAPGGAATEGKVNREMVETLAAELNDVQAKFGNVEDLRKEQPQVFAQLQSLINQVKHDYNKAGRQRADELAANYKYIDDDKVQQTVNNKKDILYKKFADEAPKAPTGASNTVPDGRIAVKGPDGKTWHLPKAQLADALTQGYTEIK